MNAAVTFAIRAQLNASNSNHDQHKFAHQFANQPCELYLGATLSYCSGILDIEHKTRICQCSHSDTPRGH